MDGRGGATYLIEWENGEVYRGVIDVTVADYYFHRVGSRPEAP